MAYNFFPESTQEIDTGLAGTSFSSDRIDDCKRVFEYCKNKFPKIKTPINIDKEIPSKINVTRMIQDKFSLDEMKRHEGVQIGIKWGEGSSGNRGANNRGLQFEKDFSDAMQNWYEGSGDVDATMLEAIEAIDEKYGPLGPIITYNANQAKMGKHQTIKNIDGKSVVLDMGAANTKRPLTYGTRWYIKNPGSSKNLGPVVGDLAVYSRKLQEMVYLSLKVDKTTTFFNVGLKSYMPTKDIQNWTLPTSGYKLLDLFGIEPEGFFDIFNAGTEYNVDEVTQKPLKKGQSDWAGVTANGKTGSDLKHLLQTGIGHGYYVVHGYGATIDTYEIDESYMRSASTITGTPTIYYGGKTGTGKRIDIEMESTKYKFKINIRDTQGTDGYPTRMMCDFTKK